MHLHGKWRIEKLNDHLLLIEAKESWNIEGTQAFVSEFKEVASTLQQNSWGTFFSLVDGDLVHPDAIGLLQELGDWSARHGCCCEVVWLGSKLQGFQVNESRPDGLPDIVKHKATFDLQEATDFLNQHGFKVSIQQLRGWLTR